MRFLLAALSSFLLLNAQIYAIPAGPVFESGSAGANTTGTYSGLLLPSDDQSNTSSTSLNSLGLFTLLIPPTGLGSGTFVMFTGGRTYTGTIRGFGNPDTGAVNAVLKAEFADTIIARNNADGTRDEIQGPSYHVDGNLRATVSNKTSGFSTAVGQISGKAVLVTTSPSTDVYGNKVDVITTRNEFIVDGLQQSFTTTTSG